MFTLDKTKGFPFAVIEGGFLDGNVLRVDPFPNKEELGINKYVDPIEILESRGLIRNIKKTPKKTYEQLKDLIYAEEERPDEEIQQLYEKARETLKQRSGAEFILNRGGCLRLIPNFERPEKRLVIYLTGTAGAGKTTMACDFLKKYRMFFPDREIYLYVHEMCDPTIKQCEEEINANFIDINAKNFERVEESTEKFPWLKQEKKPKKRKRESDYEIVQNPIPLNSMTDCAILYDDVQYLPEEDVRKAVLKLCDASIGAGRKLGQTVIITGQLATDYQRTRLTLNEADFIFGFPRSGVSRGLEYLFREYLGIGKNKDLMNRILNVPSDWFAIHTKNPQFCMHEKGAFLLK